jgi:molybdopterin-dependent oxidoreductase alpha subunit
MSELLPKSDARTSLPDPYPKPAAGWGALFSTMRELWRNQTFARGTGALLRLNQPNGFDCPGCAWPEPGHAARFEFCENGAKAIAAETTGKRITPDFFQQHTVNDLRTQTDYWLEQQGRLTEPMSYDAATDKYVPISWDDAFSLIGREMRACTNPDQAIFYTSGRTSNEAAFLYQLFGRAFGTNNFPDCSNMCHESSGTAMSASVGIGKGTVLLDDFAQSDCILVIGQNPGTNHPRMLSALQDARRAGARVIAINPLREAGLLRFTHPQHVTDMLTGNDAQVATDYVQPLVGGDLALFTGIIKVAFAAEAFSAGTFFDTTFIREQTNGFAELEKHIHATSWADIVAHSGIEQKRIEEIASLIISSKRIIACWAMGLTQHKHGVATIQMVTNLLLLGGHIGRPGAGLCPVRGHSNVQGDRTMGISELPKEGFLQALDKEFGIQSPRHHGFDVVAAIDAMAADQARVFIAMGGNFVAAAPDTQHTAQALSRCQLTVQITTKLNRSHLAHGKKALILPCLGRSEQDIQASGPQQVTVEDSMSMVHASQGRLTPASPHLRSEPAIVAGIAQATLTGAGAQIPWADLCADYRNIRARIARVMPELFSDFETRLAKPGGFHLRNSAREREWRTVGNKAHFIVAPIPDLNLPEGQLRLMTMRSHDQYNTTIYGLDDRYRGIYGKRRVVFCNPDDIRELGFQPGEMADLISCFPDRERRVDNFEIIAYDIPRGCAAAYFPEANNLVSVASFADGSRTPTSKFIPLRLVKRDK